MAGFRDRCRLPGSASARLDYERSRFEDPASASVDGVQVIERRRRDASWQAAVEVSRRLTAEWSVAAGYSYTDQDSSFEVYDYRRSQVFAGVKAAF